MASLASGVVTAPAAGTAIATLTAPPAGVYIVKVLAAVSNAAVADLNNMRLRRAGVDILSPIPHGANGSPLEFVIGPIALNGTQNLTVEAIGIGTAAIEYSAAISAELSG